MYQAISFILAFSSLASAETLTLIGTSETRCKTAREPGACYELADIYLRTSRIKSIEQGKTYVMLGCEIERKRKCSLVEADQGRAAFMKNKKAWDAEKEKALLAIPQPKHEYELKCEKHDAKACGDAGLHFQFLATPTDSKKSSHYYEEGCRLGDASSCNSVELNKKGIIKVFEIEP